MKYYHPSVSAGEYNWDYKLFRILSKILNVKSKKERNSILDNWRSNVGSFETIEKENQIKEKIKFSPNLSWIDQKTLEEELTKTLNKAKLAKRSNENYYVRKMPGVGNPEF